MSKIVNFVGPVHMGRQHKGLHEEAEKNDIDLESLPRGSFVIFVATHQRRYKAYGMGRVFIDQDLSPMTLEEYLLNNGALDVGLSENILLSLNAKNKAAMSRFFSDFKKNQKQKLRKKT